ESGVAQALPRLRMTSMLHHRERQSEVWLVRQLVHRVQRVRILIPRRRKARRSFRAREISLFREVGRRYHRCKVNEHRLSTVEQNVVRMPVLQRQSILAESLEK